MIRLHKLLAHLGLFGSRRHVERKIISGNIYVNGNISKIGDKVKIGDKISIDNKSFLFNDQLLSRRLRIIIYNKPLRQICSKFDVFGRPSVFSNIPKIFMQRWVMVGRLDFNTIGLLMFTNNGDFAYRLMHPSYRIEREYVICVLKNVSSYYLNLLCEDGIEIDNCILKFRSIKPIPLYSNKNINKTFNNKHKFYYKIILLQGKNREIRKVFKYLNIKIDFLIRIRYGKVYLPNNLDIGCFRELPINLVNLVRNSVSF